MRERERDYVDTTSPPGPVETDENREEEKLKLANFFFTKHNNRVIIKIFIVVSFIF